MTHEPVPPNQHLFHPAQHHQPLLGLPPQRLAPEIEESNLNRAEGDFEIPDKGIVNCESEVAWYIRFKFKLPQIVPLASYFSAVAS